MPQTDSRLLQCIVFQLGAEWFAVPIAQMRGIERWRPPTPVPGTPPAILGIINQRGMLVTVLDIRMLLGQKPEPPTRRTRLLFASAGDTDVALLADHVADLLDLDVARAEAPPHRASGFSSGLLHTPFGLATWLDLGLVLHALIGSVEGGASK